MRIALFEALSRIGYEVLVAEDGRMALDIASRKKPDLVITGLKMPEMDGLELTARLRGIDSALPVVVITSNGTVESAVQAMKLGVVDYILKPFSVEVIEETVARVLGSVPGPPAPVAERQGTAKSWDGERPIIGQDGKLLRVLERAKSVAPSKATVLILGESGTGKELIARYIHRHGNRRQGPFIAINCAALPEGLLESELFGHEKGAFTGAIAVKKGKFELADGGVLLLDEIGEIPLHLQAKLLRVLQEEEVDRLGGKAPIKIDVHVVATTNRDLKKAAAAGTFRNDLYYRLNVIPLHLPPLRERREDIPFLATHFLEKYSNLYRKQVKGISDASLARLLANPWNGNIREMENLIERALLLCRGEWLEPDDFWDEEDRPAAESAPTPILAPATDGATLWEVERQMILQALNKNDSNRTHAAKVLGISVRTLRNKLQEYRQKGLFDEAL